MSSSRRTISTALIVLGSLVHAASAQVAPVSADATTTGPGAGVTSPISPTGAYQAAVPIELPPARGNVPIPFAIAYTGLARAGAAGAGWDVPLSYVRRSHTTRHRKPAAASNIVGEDNVPERILVSLAGGLMVMVPSETLGVYLPFASDSYMELRDTDDGWTLSTSSGVDYVFTDSTDDLALLSQVRDRQGTDRVELTYASPSSLGCHELDLVGLAYGFGPDDRPLYEISLDYAPWWEEPTTPGLTREQTQSCGENAEGTAHSSELSQNDDLGPLGSRYQTITRVAVLARNNLDLSSSPEELRAYSLAYVADADTSLPRLHDVSMTGEAGVGASVAVATYEYAAAIAPTARTGDAQRVTRPAFAEAHGFTSLASSSTQDWEITAPGLLYPEGMAGETTVSRHLIRDFTGDGVPDFLFNYHATWYLYPGTVGDTGSALALPVVSSWDEPANMFEQMTSHYTDEGSAAAHWWMTTTDTWVQFLDWNGDGRLDVVDALSAGPGRWRIWINRPTGEYAIEWEPHDIEPTDLLGHIAALGLADLPSGYVPLERSRTWPKFESFACLKSTDGGATAVCDDPSIPDDDTFPENYVVKDEQDTVSEWTLADANGDSYPDILVNSNPVRFCERETPDTWTISLPAPHDSIAIQTLTHDEWLTTQGCSDELPANQELVFLNRAGAAIVEDEGRSYPASVLKHHGSGVSRWTNAGIEGPYDPEVPVAGDSWHSSGIFDNHSLGIGRFEDVDADRALEKFKTDRANVCGPGSGAAIWTSRQVSGLADMNGDGIADHVYLDDGPNGWFVRFGTTAGFGPRHALGPENFEISLTTGTCNGTRTETSAALIDLDGDGKPEFVRADVNGLFARKYLIGADGTLGGGRLVAIENGFGARTEVTYANNKANPLTGHQIPVPEIVVAATQTKVLDGSAVDGAVVRFAYGTAESRYDPILDRVSFAGYRRSITLVGESTDRTGPDHVEGVATIVDRSPPAPPGSDYEALVLGGRVTATQRMDGVLSADPRELLDTAPLNGQIRAGHRSTSAVQPLYGVAGIADLGFAECVDIDPSTGERFDTALCNQAGIIYEQVSDSWEGQHPLPSDENVVQSTEVTEVDSLGRPLRLISYGDIWTTDDETCVQITYATPVDNEPLTTQGIAAIWVDDCGWTYPVVGAVRTNGGPLLIAGTRFVYDDLPEGEIARGKLTARIIENYDVGTGAFLGEFAAEELTYNEMGQVSQILRNRALGSAATQYTSFEYDAFGASVRAIHESASDVSEEPFTKTQSVSTWPSNPSVEVGLNGETTTVERDRFGRPTSTAILTAAFSHQLSQTIYDDDPSGREITSIVSPGGATSSTAQITHVHLDALGRPRFKQSELGADYGGTTLITDLVQYDALGRVAYQAAPFEWAELPFAPEDLGPNAIDLPYGVTLVRDEAGRTIRAIEAYGRRPDLSRTSLDDDTFVSTTSFAWEGGRAKVRSSGPTENDLTSATFGSWSESTATALGRVEEQARFTVSGARLDLTRYAQDRLGHETLLRRFGNPTTAGDAVDWTTRFDSLGRTLEMDEPGMSPRLSEYDEWGEPISSEIIDGDVHHLAQMTYDGFGRLTGRKLFTVEPISSGTVDSDESFFYDLHSGSSWQPVSDLRGRLSRIHEVDAGDIFYAYDSLGRLASETYDYRKHPDLVRTSWDYEPGGQLRQLSFETAAGVDHIAYAYDSAGRTRSITDVDADVTLFSAPTIDPKGRYREIALGNGVTEGFAYADHGREELKQWSVQTIGESRTEEFALRDAEGRLLQEVTSAGTDGQQLTHTYDLLDRLVRSATTQSSTSVTVSDERFDYDPLGNVTRRDNAAIAGQEYEYQYDSVDRDRVCRFDPSSGGGSGCNFEYDAFGSVVSDSSAGTLRTFDYDAAGRIRGITKGGATAKFRYGPGGSRIRTDVWTDSFTLDRSVWSFGGLVEERVRPDHARQIERSIPGPLGIVATLRTEVDSSTAETIYVHGDGRANRFFTKSDGTIAQSADYDAYGALTGDSGVASALSYSDDLWNGGDDLGPVGVVVLGARIYDPTLGRFLQRDPVVIGGSSTQGNPYSFSFNDPINFADPSGATPFYAGTIYSSYSSSEQTNYLSFITGIGAAGYAIWQMLDGGASPVTPNLALGGGTIHGIGWNPNAWNDEFNQGAADAVVNTVRSGAVHSTPAQMVDDMIAAATLPGRVSAAARAGGHFIGTHPSLVAEVANDPAAAGSSVANAAEASAEWIGDHPRGAGAAAASVGLAICSLAAPELGVEVASMGLRASLESEFGESLAGYEFFLHGTTEEVAQGFELERRSLFTSTDPQVARLFAERTVAKAGRGTPGGIAIVLPRESVRHLRSIGQLTVTPISDMPALMEWVFHPGAYDTLRTQAEIIPLRYGVMR